MMTRKHFELIAMILKNAMESDEDVRWIAKEFAYRLRFENDYFKPDVFLEACGFGSEVSA